MQQIRAERSYWLDAIWNFVNMLAFPQNEEPTKILKKNKKKDPFFFLN